MKNSAGRVFVALWLVTSTAWFGQSAFGESTQTTSREIPGGTETVFMTTFDDGSWSGVSVRVRFEPAQESWYFWNSEGYWSSINRGTDWWGHAYFLYSNSEGNESGYYYSTDGSTYYAYENAPNSTWYMWAKNDGSSYVRSAGLNNGEEIWYEWTQTDANGNVKSGSWNILEDLGNIKVVPNP